MKKNIGKELKLARVKAELTLQDVSKSLGLSPSTLSCAERGKGGLSVMKKIAAFWGFELVEHVEYTLKKKTDENN